MHDETPGASRLLKLQEQRCLLLFLALVGLLVAVPFLGETPWGQAILVFVHITVLLTAVAAVGRTWRSFGIAAILVLPAVVFRVLSLKTGRPEHLALTLGFNAVFYVFVLTSLLRYVFRLDIMSRDKLYGAVAAYILIAIFWSYLHALTQYFYPGAYTFAGAPRVLDIGELIYFSFTALSTAGFGDIAPAVVQSRYLTVLEMVVGVMFVAILIARLTGVYPIVDRRS
jgi:Ion channel